MLPMRGAEGIVNVDIAELGELLTKLRIVLFFVRTKAAIY